MSRAQVHVAHHGAIAVLTLDNPGKRNALSPALLDELQRHLSALLRAGTRAAVLTGHGDAAFSAGYDLDALPEEPDDAWLRDHGPLGPALRALQALPVVAVRFPGRLRVDRYRVSGRALRPGQYGGLLELAVQLGVPAGELLLERLADPHRDVRFYAAVCLAHLRLRSAVYPLVERLFDADYGVRACAIEALATYPARDLDLAMVRARHALHSEDLERVEAATTAIAELGDRAAIPDLIDIVGRDTRRGEHARRALVALTRVDHATSERRWRKWWDEHRERHRVEWPELWARIDALTGFVEAPQHSRGEGEVRHHHALEVEAEVGHLHLRGLQE